jgi:hypothetical protein
MSRLSPAVPLHCSATGDDDHDDDDASSVALPPSSQSSDDVVVVVEDSGCWVGVVAIANDFVPSRNVVRLCLKREVPFEMLCLGFLLKEMATYEMSVHPTIRAYSLPKPTLLIMHVNK